MPSKKSVVVAVLVAYFAYRFYASRNGPPAQPLRYAPVIETANGPVRGIVSLSRDGRPYHEYRGIPYGVAERFEPPKPYAKKWSADEPRDASQFGPECLQMGMLIGNIGGEEDCLFLNVYVPEKASAAGKKSLLPVLVFIHGGHFTEGASEKYLPEFLVDEDLIVVTMNYRLGVLGFLNTGDGIVRGNMGLKDQTLALRWIAANVKAFGGDPQRVTLSGESAGSVCVHYHMLSPASRGLFQRAISMSGTALAPWSIISQPKQQAMRFAKRARCPVDDTKEMVRCLRKLQGPDLIALQSDILEYPRNPMAIFAPTVESVHDEHSFLVQNPEDVLRSGKFNKVPYLTGVNSHEGLIVSAQIMAIDGALDKMEQDTTTVLPPVLYLPASTSADTVHKIRTQYFGEGVPINSRDVFDNYTSLTSDRHFFVSLEKTVRLQVHATPTDTDAAPVYVYYYEYRTEFSLARILMAIRRRFPVLLELLAHVTSTWAQKNVFGTELEYYGVCHADELALFFHMPDLAHVDRHHRDYAFSKSVVRLWADFVNGRELVFQGVKWEPVQSHTLKERFKYLHIDSRSSGMVTPPFRERLKFWDSLNLKE